MRRLAPTLGAVAFLWAAGASLYLLRASSPGGLATSAIRAGGGGGVEWVPPSLETATGVWLTAMLVCVTVLAGIPLGVALGRPSANRLTAWTIGSVLLAFCVLAGAPVGLLYLPTTVLVLLAGAAGQVEQRGRGLADSRA